MKERVALLYELASRVVCALREQDEPLKAEVVEHLLSECREAEEADNVYDRWHYDRQWAIEQAIAFLKGRDPVTPMDVVGVANAFLDFTIPRWKPVEDSAP